MPEWLANPALVIMAGGLLAAVCPRAWLGALAVALPALGLTLLWQLPLGTYAPVTLFQLELATIRIDGLSRIWATIFHIAGGLAGLYAWHVRDRVQHAAALIYAGAAIGAVLAADLVTLFIYWELTAIASVFLIWARGTARAYRVGMRYLVIQVVSGLLLMAGAIIHYRATGSLAFNQLGLEVPGGWLIFLAFGIKCAFPLLHNWLQDAYPEATVTGTVVLSVFTTKLAVYALARGFAGEEILITIGAAMTAFPIFFAVIENDLRRVLAYSLNNQLGFMVVGIGIGTEMALNGAAAHAFAHILYKALLFMSMGAVLYRVGTIKASELGGLYKSMPLTAVFCIIGAMSISAFPLFSGFVTKSMILTAAAVEHHWVAWLVLLFASAGVLDHSGIKVPFFSFFHHDVGHRVPEAPWNMLAAMGITALLCIAIGVYPAPLYAILPFAVDYAPYTTAHVITQLQLLLFAALAFTTLFRRGWYPPEIPALNLDSDWVYRRLAPLLLTRVRGIADRWGDALSELASGAGRRGLALTRRVYQPDGVLAKPWGTGVMTLWVAVLLAAYLLFYFG
ncbi:Na(+)/H(+) antiporter subunit D [Spectribacter hydrogenoxidans]|uniref:Na(+)/H(+) antiporter subunit D n=1 Tax=Spectribacter hydrogenoxidans TaxID=3075608 RepID=A0ABU3C1B2_9GAMM|nr:Na(+)/H(+) antiporter subunit D [Salinisphaera sp. W335]MDT0635149.1 Na(+)/H(+) antiporter subunit D [Salinisphaera sp. W335]